MKRVEALRALQEVAAEQAGLVTSAQATARGVDRVTQQRLADAELLENVGRGVYRMVGAPPPSHLELRVAWLRLDPATPAWQRDGRGPDDGVVSHRSAAILHELGDIPAPQIELTAPRRRTTREPDVRLHIGVLAASDITFVEGLPVTTVERTIVDLLESRADGAHVGRIIADADRRGLIDLSSLERNVAGYSRRYGLPGNAGADLLANLAEQAGERLSTTDAKQAMLTGVLAGPSVSDVLHKVATSRADVAVSPGNEKLLAAFTQNLLSQNEKLSASVSQAVGSKDEELHAAITNALMSSIQAISAQAVAAILNNRTLTGQLVTASNLPHEPHPRQAAADDASHVRENEAN